MTSAINTIVLVAALGSALVAGIFYAFSSFIMKALARIPTAQGISAMQSINVVVLTPSFLGLFSGTAVFSLLIAFVAVNGWGASETPFWLAGAVVYLLGTFAVTAFGNVPLNDRLAKAPAANLESIELWKHYVNRWTTLNSVRTAASAAASLLFVLGLLRQGS